MTSKPNDSSSSEEFKDGTNIKYVLSKFEYDLYHEESDVAEQVIRIKRFSLPNKGEKWKVFVDTKVELIIEGSKLTNKEKEFLRTADGLNFLISKFKSGIKSFNVLKNEIKSHLTNIK